MYRSFDEVRRQPGVGFHAQTSHFLPAFEYKTSKHVCLQNLADYLQMPLTENQKVRWFSQFWCVSTQCSSSFLHHLCDAVQDFLTNSLPPTFDIIPSKVFRNQKYSDRRGR
jgi:hypothetical protein